MSFAEELKVELNRIAHLNKESARIKAKRSTPKQFQFDNVLNAYYRDQADLSDYPRTDYIQTPDELTEEEKMNKLGDRSKRKYKIKSKRKIKKCRCK